MFLKISTIKNLAKLTGKHRLFFLFSHRPSSLQLFLKKYPEQMFPVNFAKLLRTAFSKNTFVDSSCLWKFYGSTNINIFIGFLYLSRILLRILTYNLILLSLLLVMPILQRMSAVFHSQTYR